MDARARWMSTKEVARLTKVTPGAVRYWTRYGVHMFPHGRITPAGWMFERVKVLRWIFKMQHLGTKRPPMKLGLVADKVAWFQ